MCKISVCSTSARSRSGSLYEDPFGPLVSGSCRTTCTRSLYQGPLDRLCQDPARPLVQDLCIGILLDHCIRIRLDNLCKICLRICVRILWTTCIRILQEHLACYEDTCARSLYQDPVLCLRISVLGSTFGPLASRYCKRANSARLPRKLKIRSSKTSVLCETSSKTKAPDFQNERFVRDFLEN